MGEHPSSLRSLLGTGGRSIPPPPKKRKINDELAKGKQTNMTKPQSVLKQNS